MKSKVYQKENKNELNRSTHSRLTMQFVTIIAGTAVLDAVAAQLIRYAIARSALEVVRGLAEQPN